jgi:hypothetical protein
MRIGSPTVTVLGGSDGGRARHQSDPLRVSRGAAGLGSAKRAVIEDLAERVELRPLERFLPGARR